MPFIFISFFKGGIWKYNALFEDISDQHIEEDIYNVIRAFLTIPGYIVITATTLLVSHMQIKEFWRWLRWGTNLFLCITTKHQKLACLLIPTS